MKKIIVLISLCAVAGVSSAGYVVDARNETRRLDTLRRIKPDKAIANPGRSSLPAQNSIGVSGQASGASTSRKK